MKIIRRERRLNIQTLDNPEKPNCQLCGLYQYMLCGDHCHIHNIGRGFLCEPCNRMVERSGIYGQEPKIGLVELWIAEGIIGERMGREFSRLANLVREWEAPTKEDFAWWITSKCSKCYKPSTYVHQEPYPYTIPSRRCICGCGTPLYGETSTYGIRCERVLRNRGYYDATLPKKPSQTKIEFFRKLAVAPPYIQPNAYEYWKANGGLKPRNSKSKLED